MATYPKAQAKREARIARIRELAGTMPAWKIAEELHIAPESLNHFCYTHGIKLAYVYNRCTDEERAWIVAERDAGRPYAEIAAATGRTIGTVRTIVSYAKRRGLV